MKSGLSALQRFSFKASVMVAMIGDVPAIVMASISLFKKIPGWWFQICFIFNLTWKDYHPF